MDRTKIGTFVFALFMTAGSVFGGEGENAIRLLTTKLQGLYAQISADYAKATQAIPGNYTALLDKMRNEYKAEGDLDGVLAIDREINRFNEMRARTDLDPFELTPEMPESAIVEEPETLRAAQLSYIQQYKDRGQKKNEDIRKLKTLYLEKLIELQKNFTRADKLEDALACKRASQQDLDKVLRGAIAPKTSEDEPRKSETSTRTTVAPEKVGAPWTTWKWQGERNFVQERTQIAHPDTPDELAVSYSRREGKGRFFGKTTFGMVQIGASYCASFGKALVWQVSDPNNLNATIALKSKFTSRGEGYGPLATIAIFDGAKLVRALDISLMAPEERLRVIKETSSNRCALMWPRGRQLQTFELPESNDLRVVLGVAVKEEGEKCETEFEFL